MYIFYKSLQNLLLLYWRWFFWFFIRIWRGFLLIISFLLSFRLNYLTYFIWFLLLLNDFWPLLLLFLTIINSLEIHALRALHRLSLLLLSYLDLLYEFIILKFISDVFLSNFSFITDCLFTILLVYSYFFFKFTSFINKLSVIVMQPINFVNIFLWLILQI